MIDRQADPKDPTPEDLDLNKVLGKMPSKTYEFTRWVHVQLLLENEMEMCEAGVALVSSFSIVGEMVKDANLLFLTSPERTAASCRQQ